MHDQQLYTLTVNGQEHQVAATPQTTLLTVLREELHLTGTKDGCATGHCGSCMVLKDGEATRACLVPMKRAEGARITTIEGLQGPDGGLHPVQQAYIDQGATQCGFCTPGFVMASAALLDKNPNPGLDEIYEAHRWNICRCTGHNAIIRAVMQAAGQPVPPPPAAMNPLKTIGHPLPRPDAVDKASGKGLYAADGGTLPEAGRIEGQVLALLGQRRGHLGQRGAGAHGDDQLGRFVADDARPATGVQRLAVHGLTVEGLGVAAADAQRRARGDGGPDLIDQVLGPVFGRGGV